MKAEKILAELILENCDLREKRTDPGELPEERKQAQTKIDYNQQLIELLARKILEQAAVEVPEVAF